MDAILNATVAASGAIDQALGLTTNVRPARTHQLRLALADAIAKHLGAVASDELAAQRGREDEFDVLARQAGRR